jgi:hypothetical protein
VKFQRSKTFAEVSKMPAAKKHQPEESFDIAKSEIVRWLVQRPIILQYLFDKVKESGAIIYDAETGTWKGCDTP